MDLWRVLASLLFTSDSDWVVFWQMIKRDIEVDRLELSRGYCWDPSTFTVTKNDYYANQKKSRTFVLVF